MPILKLWIIGAAAVGCCIATTTATAGDDIAPRETSALQLAQFPSIPSRKQKQQSQPEQPKPRSITDKGIVSAVTADSISIVVDKKLWVLRPQPHTVVEITGQAEPSYLKPGMIVRFYGEFDKKLKPLAPFQRIEIVSANMPNVAPGIFPDTLPPEVEEDKAKQAAEEKPAGEMPPDDKPEASDKPAAEAGKPMMVVGTLKLFKDNELLVSAGNRTIRVQLAEEPEIRVSLSDFTVAKRSDAVTKFSCDYIQPGAGLLKLLLIELTNPLEGPKKPVKKTVAKPIAKPPAKDKGKTK